MFYSNLLDSQFESSTGSDGKIPRTTLESHQFTQVMADYCFVISRQQNIHETVKAACRCVEDAIPGSRSRIFLHDRKDLALYTVSKDLSHEKAFAISAGLIGYVTRNGECIRIECLQEDVRYMRASDNPEGMDDDCFMAAPILNMDGVVLGIITVARAHKDSFFSVEELTSLRFLASATAPTLTILLEFQRNMTVSDAKAALRGSDLFRAEALEHHLNFAEQDGSLLHSMPYWLRRSHAAIMVLTVCSLIFLGVVRVPETVNGSAVVRTRVVSEEDAGQKQPATANASVPTNNPQAEVVCFFPIAYSADIRPGMKMELSQGSSGMRETLTIGTARAIYTVSDSGFDAEKTAAGAAGVSPPLVVVHSYAPGKVFSSADGTIPNLQGSFGQATIRVRSKTLITSLIPGLSKVLDSWKSAPGAK